MDLFLYDFSLRTWRMNSSCRKLHDLSIHTDSSGPENVLRTHRTFMHTYGHKRDATDDIWYAHDACVGYLCAVPSWPGCR